MKGIQVSKTNGKIKVHMSLGNDECFVTLGQPPFLSYFVFCLCCQERERKTATKLEPDFFLLENASRLSTRGKIVLTTIFCLGLPPSPAHRGPFLEKVAKECFRL